MSEKEITLDNLEDSFFGEDDLFNEKIFKKSELVNYDTEDDKEDISLEDLEESE